jgi:hypothetical protein
MTAERFIREYAAAKRRMIAELDWMSDAEKKLMFDEITKAVHNRELGHITADEAVRHIANLVYGGK